MGRLKAKLVGLKHRWTVRALLIALATVTLGGGAYAGLKYKGRNKAAAVPGAKVVTGVAASGEAGLVDAAALAPPTTLSQPSTAAPISNGYGDYGYNPSGTTPSYGYADASPASSPAANDQPPPNPYRNSGAYGSDGNDAAEPQSYAGPEIADQPTADQPYSEPQQGEVVQTNGETTEPAPGAYAQEAPVAIPPENTLNSAPSYGANVPSTNPYLAPPTTQPPSTLPSTTLPSTQRPGMLPSTSLSGGGLAQPPAAIPSSVPSSIPSTIPSTTNTANAYGQRYPSTNEPAPLQGMDISNPLSSQPQPQPPSGAYGGLSPRPLGAATSASEGIGEPGERHLEGVQSPSLTVEKFAPPEIQIGKAANFEVRVRNIGQAPAANVVVTDHVPRGTTLIDAKPEYTRSADGALAWNLGTLQPGAETTIQMQLMPQSEGEIGSIAQVTFAAHATARAICTRPMLVVEHTAPPKVMIGQPVTMSITVTNPGTGAATGVVIDEDVPAGLVHAAGSELEYEIGTLRPGESKRLDLHLKAEKAGIIENAVVVRGDANLTATHRVQIEVIAPQLQVDVNGPKKRFLQRQATYTVSVANPGTATARDVEVVAYLPRGMKFVDTDAQGQYDPQQHAVFWSLEELPAAKSGNVTLVAMPVEAGEQRLRIEGRAELGLTTANEQIVQVDAAAELRHTVSDLSDPIEIGSETTYEIRIVNSGTKTATNVRVGALAAAEMRLVSGDGPTRGTVSGQQIAFEPLPRLNPQEEAIFKVQAQGLRSGDHIIRVQLSSDEWPTPVSREESTRVYEDQ